MNALLIILGVVAAIVTVSILIGIGDTLRLRRLAQERRGDSICSFARSLDYRRLDTTIIRAVHEGFQEYLNNVYPGFPVRPSDDVYQVYGIDPEDYEDMIVQFADRMGRSLEGYDRNPYYRQISTVSGLIEFLCDQPAAQGV
jgi:hypothetical protein